MTDMRLPVQDLGSAFFKMAPVTQFLFDVIVFLWDTYLMQVVERP